MEESKNVIIIDGLQYTYEISKMEDDKGISIILKEINPEIYVIFKYEAEINNVLNDIKALRLYDNIQEMIDALKDIFNIGKITYQFRERKYFLLIEVQAYGKTSKFEIELQKQQLNNPNELLMKLKIMESQFNEIKEELNNLKNKSTESNLLLYKEDKKKVP